MTRLLHMTRGGAALPPVWVLGLPTLMLAIAWAAPALLPGLIAALLALGALAVAYHHLTLVWTAWLLVAGLSLEMTLTDLIGPGAFQTTIAAVKAAEIGLCGLAIVRFGLARDMLNPAWGFAVMAMTGAVVGTHPDLTAADSTRSLIGSVTPYLPFFCAMPAAWGRTIRRAVTWLPALSVVLGLGMDLAGVRSLFVDSGGARLQALGHPAFLAGVCLPAIYADLLRWLRTGSAGSVLGLVVNLGILLLTGARAPAACAVAVIGISLVFAPDAAVPRAHRLAIAIGGLAALPVLLVLGETFSSLRLFSILTGEAGHLSGRDLLWPAFEAAAAQAPWFGWGLGAGNVIIPQQGEIAQLLRTWAAHNEYLRIEVEGGQLGRALLILLFVSWITLHTRRLPRPERLTMRAVFLAHAVHAATDNVLISTPACVFFAFAAAVFADARGPLDKRLRPTADLA